MKNISSLFTKNNYLLICISISGIILLFFPKWIVDDSFILFRYAENFVTKGELNWNIGENPVEGYTGVLSVLLLSIGYLLKLNPILISHTIGVTSLIFSIVLIYFIQLKININQKIAFIITLMFSTAPAIYTHVFSGLETILFIFLILAVVYFGLTLFEKKNNNIIYFIVLLLLSLVRPEGLFFSVLSFCILLIYFYKYKKPSLVTYSKNSFFIYFLPFSLYLTYKTIYYGAIFPNTYYIKSAANQFNISSYFSLIYFFKYYFFIPVTICVILLISTYLFVYKNKSEIIYDVKVRFTAVLIIIFSLILIGKYLFTSLLMNYSYRFYIPIFPIVLILIGYIINKLFGNFTRLFVNKAYYYIVSAAIFALILIQINIIYFQFRKEVLYTAKHILLIENVHKKVGCFLRNNFSDSKILVHADAGAIPYYSKLQTIDFGGLNDEYLARTNNLTKQNIIDYFFNVNADILIITSFNSKEIKRIAGSLNWDTLQLIIKDKRFNNYELIKTFGTETWNYFEFVYKKKAIH